ncbi:FkbM family methyltransferase [Cyanobacteria bacterium FACHB-471]|nr:FkbM family methyltransferase [Cyanobacteria bacterium FACHB-471]
MEKSRRILIISNLYPPQVLGGYERSIADFARLLHHLGHQVLVLTTDNPAFATSHVSQSYPDPTVERCLTLAGEWRRGSGTDWFTPAEVERISQLNLNALADWISRFQPDVALAGNIDFLGVHLLEFLLSREIPVAHYVMNMAPSYLPERTPNSLLHRYITCSNWLTDVLREGNYPTETTKTIYPGAIVEEFYQDALPTRDRLRIAYASIVMLYKGADVLVEALSLLNAMGVDFSATFAGDTLEPQFVEELKRFIESEGFLDRVTFAGPLSRQELKELYKTHNVLVFPSRFQEPFGISQIEAMAAGLALITSGTGGAAEIVEHGVNGLKFESENPFALAEALSYLVSNPEEWEAIAQQGQQKAMTQFTQRKAVEELIELLEELIAYKHSEAYKIAVSKKHQVGTFALMLPSDHNLDAYQATWKRYDKALGYISQITFKKYPNSTAIDIGANVGDTAALIRTYNKNVPLLCVEGNPEFLFYLETNAQQIGNVKIAKCFIGNDNKEVDAEKISSHGGTTSVLEAVKSGAKHSIPMQSLATLFQSYSQFRTSKLLKIDTDGYDFQIIQSSLEILKTHQPILFFEYDIFVTPNGERESLLTLQALTEIGYEKFIIYDNFGNYLLSLTAMDGDRFYDLNAYLRSNHKKSGRAVVYYLDICAFSQQDIDLFEQIRSQELSH